MTSDSEYSVLADRIVLVHAGLKAPEHVIQMANDSGWNKNPHEQYDDGVDRRFESSVTINTLDPKGKLILESLTKSLNLYADVIGSTVDESNYAVGESWVVYVSKYLVGGRANLHTDEGFTEDNGIYTVIVYLNDDYEGGEVSFPNHEVTIKQAAGDVLIFPSYYLHYSDPVISGEKYMAISRLRY